MLVVADGVERSHLHLVFFSVEHHRYLCIECLLYLLSTASGLFHGTVALTLSHGAMQNLVNLITGEVQERCSRITFLFVVECFLQIARYVVGNTFLCKFLHTTVECSIDFQSVSIYIIM